MMRKYEHQEQAGNERKMKGIITMENSEFRAYEYKKISVKSDSIALYADCLENFGWMPTHETINGYGASQIGYGAANLGVSIANYAIGGTTGMADGADMVTLKFKRNSRIANKQELNRLERQCLEELSAIDKAQKKDAAKTMGLSLGSGIVGAACLTGAILSFRAGAVLPGILFLVPAVAGWALGFFVNLRLRKKTTEQSSSQIDKHYEEAYAACEAAHRLLAQG